MVLRFCGSVSVTVSNFLKQIHRLASIYNMIRSQREVQVDLPAVTPDGRSTSGHLQSQGIHYDYLLKQEKPTHKQHNDLFHSHSMS